VLVPPPPAHAAEAAQRESKQEIDNRDVTAVKECAAAGIPANELERKE
jgi:hypothetical protein